MSHREQVGFLAAIGHGGGHLCRWDAPSHRDVAAVVAVVAVPPRAAPVARAGAAGPDASAAAADDAPTVAPSLDPNALAPAVAECEAQSGQARNTLYDGPAEDVAGLDDVLLLAKDQSQRKARKQKNFERSHLFRDR